MTIPPISDQPSSGAPATPPSSRPPYFEEPVPSYMAPAVLVTILCCLPAGIVAVYFAAKVASYQAVGNRMMATRCSDKAKMWCWISGLLFLIWPVLLIAGIIAGGIGLFEALESGCW